MKKINKSDVQTLKRIDKLFNKLDEILNRVSNNNASDIEKIVSDKDKRFVADDRNYYRDYINFKHFSINYGFGWFLKGEAFVYLDFCIGKEIQSDRNGNKIAKLIKNKINGIAELYNNENAISLGFKQRLEDFVNDENQEDLIVKLLNEWIRKIKNFKDNNPDLFEI